MARPREFDEDEVVARAREVFWTAGYAATSVHDLVAATGLSRGSLYGAFGDKRGLFLRALDSYCDATVAAVHADLDGDDAGAARRIVAHMAHVADNCGGNMRGCFLAKSTAALAATDPAVAERAERTYGTYETVLAGCLAQAQRHGDLAPRHDPGALAALLLITVRGMETLGQAGRSLRFMRQVARHSVAFLDEPTR
ncbi:TetR family transcriptional regulator [Virgisporangium aliadipatigenens]|uniref:TetR family transcriptional regulator n=1 Tax=Virgisporangium aliadipatigenens TaxID=741659 RepID=A0A8J3YFZ0_9ACTN|nr:TetR/AcrR family transcriptional regulator [Virgisporangium aliadipatigenens]GIJ43313.1 TetR family transcriptional regulator [Virgisporangium aliadipatigenens]